MPIYAYKCESCGFAKDVLQKMSDAPLDVCPSCGAWLQEAVNRCRISAQGLWLVRNGLQGWRCQCVPTTAATSPEATAAPADAASPKAEPAASRPLHHPFREAKTGPTPDREYCAIQEIHADRPDGLAAAGHYHLGVVVAGQLAGRRLGGVLSGLAAVTPQSLAPPD
jgi:putative FmdB family regulatory protein